ncbi:MAG: SHOCT domain-containing protein [Desulforhopalus sp.]
MWNCDGWLTGGYPGAGNFLFGYGPFGGIMRLLIIIVLIVLIYKLFRGSRPGTNAASDKHDSLNILKARFARGEISLEEYQRMREFLIYQ